jgi:transposase-like protein
MNILTFIDEFPDEQSCIDHFKQQREKEGVKCKKCGCEKQYWLKAKNQWQCSSCKFRTCLRSGTTFQHSKLPLRKWYLAMVLMSMTKKGLSAKEMQRQLGHNRYGTIWKMMHTIRNAMGNREGLYKLNGMVEFDEAYIKKSTSTGVKLKRGKGSQGVQNVGVAAESTPLEDPNTGVKSKHCGYFKMKVLNSHQADEIDEMIQHNINEKSIVFSDKSKSYVNIEDYVETHYMEKSTVQTTITTLKWVHIAIANAKRWLLGIHHKIKGKYLQAYLDEFCYKLNRRYFGEKLFDRLVLAMAKCYW